MIKLTQIVFLLLLPFVMLSQKTIFKKYTTLATYKGDFNGDKQFDKIVVYEKICDSTNAVSVENATCRRVAIFFKAKNKYVLYGYNDQLIECSDCGGAGVGDPFRTIKIKNNFFSVESLYGSCDKTVSIITFKYDKLTKEFYLYKKNTEDYSCKEESNSNGDIKVIKHIETVKNFGKVKYVDFNR